MSKLTEAIVAKERAEAERDALAVGLEDAKAALAWLKKDRPRSQIEALATIAELTEAKERAEVERDEVREWSRLRDEDVIALGREVGRLTERLAGTHEALTQAQDGLDGISALIREALALSTTEPTS